MKLFSLLMSVILAIGITYFAFVNYHNPVSVMCPFEKEYFSISLAFIIIQVSAVGAVIGFLFAAFNYAGKMEALNAYKRKFEKMSVQSDSDETKVSALEAKIQTLEIALKNALKNND